MERTTQKHLEHQAKLIAGYTGRKVVLVSGSRTNGRMWRAYFDYDGGHEIAKGWTRGELWSALCCGAEVSYAMSRQPTPREA